MLSDSDHALYLDRLGLSAAAPDADGLARLQHAHLGHIPFEGIDPFLGTVPSLALPDIAAKILHARRGGYCYEMNALFGAALLRAGFDARRALARVRQRNPVPGARSHLCWLVEIGGRRYLADTGFGGPGPREPLLVEPGEQRVSNGTYRLTRDETVAEHVLERETPDGWKPLFSFDGAAVTDIEVAAANYVSATWDQSPFGANLLVAGFDGATRIGLFNRALSEESSGAVRQSDLASPGALQAVFARIGLSVPPDLLARIWDRLSPDPARAPARERA